MKQIILFGSTGSIGRSLLDIVGKNRDRYQINLLSCRSNFQLLAEQARAFDVPLVHLSDDTGLEAIRKLLPASTRVFTGSAALEEIISETPADLVVNAIVGAAGLEVSYHALAAGKNLALANKESLVAGGELLRSTSRRTGAQIIPIDSEHSAIFQCVQAGRHSEIEKVILTASGGPFRSRPRETFSEITVEEALNHPNWSMGEKITIDSATMMNKGLEVIEAHYLFDVSPEQIEIVIHPESIVHSMVQFKDGAVIAQMSPPDMRLPIAYALEYPHRLPTDLPRLDFRTLRRLTFEPPDADKFPSISLAYKALRQGGLKPLVLNAANEIAVSAFLAKKIKFLEIPVVVQSMLGKEMTIKELSLAALLSTDIEVRQLTVQVIEQGTLAPGGG